MVADGRTERPGRGGDRLRLSPTLMGKFGLDNVAWGSFQGFMVSSTVHKENVAWLHALLAAGAETEGYMKREETVPGLIVRVTSPEETNAFARRLKDAAEPIVRDAGLHWEDNQ
jgi:tripartite-type tricarboxylate transporter receptor subunit TctC